MNLDRHTMARQMPRAITLAASDLASQRRGSAPVNHFVVGNLLPEDWANAIRSAFPRPEAMVVTAGISSFGKGNRLAPTD